MKNALILLVCVATFAAGVRAAEIGANQAAAQPAAERLATEQLETLVAPIALYPDPLVALILPAATRPSDIVLASRYLESGGDPNAVDQQPWEDSVKALVRYREVLDYLDDNLEWTRTLGEAFLDQRDEMMAAIQTLRARAHGDGLLANSPQQEVIVEEREIRIVPAQPTVIYVPRYDPEVLYVRHVHTYSYWPRPFITFGIGYSIGAWLSYDCDWRYRTVYVVHRPAHWYYRPDWRVRYVHRHHHPDYRWTHWSPRHDRGRYHSRRDAHHSTSQVVLKPQRSMDQPRPVRHASNPGSRYDGQRNYGPPRHDAPRSTHAHQQDGRRTHSSPRTGERDGSRRGDRVQHPVPVAQPMTAPQVVSTAPVVSAPQVVTQSPQPVATTPAARQYSPRNHHAGTRADRGEGQRNNHSPRWNGGGSGGRHTVTPSSSPPTTVAAPAPAAATQASTPAATPRRERDSGSDNARAWQSSRSDRPAPSVQRQEARGRDRDASRSRGARAHAN